MNYKKIIRDLKIKYDVYTNRELAKKLGISESTIKSWTLNKKVPEKYIKLLDEKPIEQNIITTGNKNQINVNINSHNKIISNIEDELIEAFRKLNDKEKEYFYHQIKAKALEKELNNG